MRHERVIGFIGSLAVHALAAVGVVCAWRAWEPPKSADSAGDTLLSADISAAAPQEQPSAMPASPASPLPAAPALNAFLREASWQRARASAADLLRSDAPPTDAADDFGTPHPTPSVRAHLAAGGTMPSDAHEAASGGGTQEASSAVAVSGGTGGAGHGASGANGGEGEGVEKEGGTGNGRSGIAAGPPVPLPGNSRPAYPAESLRRYEEGTVRVRLVVAPSGQVAHVALVRTSGHELLDAAALEGVKLWRFAPRNTSDVCIAEQDIQFSIADTR